MSFLWKAFQKKKDEDYETILSNLAIDIHKRQVKLSEIRLRERRATLLVTLYTLAAWVAYVGIWYSGIRVFGGNARSSQAEKALRAAPTVIGPIVILFVRRIVQIWYTRIGDAEEKTLKELLKQQRTKVEEIKKKTNYYSTRDLLSKYDDGTPANSPQRPIPGGLQTQQNTPQRQPFPGKNRDPLRTPASQTAQPQRQQVPPPQRTVGPVRKQWFDKLADAVLGDDGSADQARFALICEKCFNHNGLVKESVWEDTQYVCPKCNHFNPSQKAKKQGNVPTSPVSPASVASPASPVAPAVLEQLRRRNIGSNRAEQVAEDEGHGETSMMEVDST